MSSLRPYRRGYCVIMPQFHAARLEIKAFLPQNGIRVSQSFEKRFPRREGADLRNELSGCLVGPRNLEESYVIIHVEANNLSQRFHDIRQRTVPGTNEQFRDVCFWPTSEDDVERFASYFGRLAVA